MTADDHLPYVLVVGAGAIGSYMAAAFNRAGIPVSILARGARLDVIRANGIDVMLDGQMLTAHVPCASDAASLPQPGLVILAVKTGDLDDAATRLAAVLKPGTGVVTVQNGVEAPDLVAKLLPDAEVIAARVHGFFEMEGSLTRHVGVPPSVAFGPIVDGASGSDDRLARCLGLAGIAHERPSQIRVSLWEKFLLASAIGGVGAALAVPVGQLRENAAHWAMLEGAMQEIAQLAKNQGVMLPAGCVAATLDFVAGFPKDATSSLQRDLMEGRPSEYDQLTGAVLRISKSVGLVLPVHQQISSVLEAKGYI